MRQHFTGYEADDETGLNFAQARYQSSLQGRFTSVDPLDASADEEDPQSFNRYSYVENNPINLTDPTGMIPYNGADHGWADVSGSFWPTGFDFNAPHFGGPAAIGERLMASDSGIKKLLQDLKQKKALSNDPDAIVTNSYAFYSREEYEEYFRRQYRLQQALRARNFMAGVLTEMTPVGFLYVQFLQKAIGGPEVDENSDAFNDGQTTVAVAAFFIPGPGGKAKAAKVVFGHGARHLIGTGLSRRVVERAIKAEVRSATSVATHGTGGFWGRIAVAGRTIEYRAHTLPDGAINIGTYYIPKGF